MSSQNIFQCVIRQEWEIPHSPGWYSLHGCERDRQEFIFEFGQISRGMPIKEPELVFVENDVYEIILVSKNGIWSFESEYKTIKV